MELLQRNRRSFAFALIILSLLTACDKNPVVSAPPTLEELIAMTPRENAEAEEMALMLGDDLVAPENLYRELLRDLKLLRDDFGDSIPLINQMKYFPYAKPGVLGIGLTDSAAAELRGGRFTSFDLLNKTLGANPIDTNSFASNYFSLTLTFKGRLKGAALVALYDTIPGIRYTQKGIIPGDWSNIYPWSKDGKRVFLLREASGDCFVGCIASEYHYFIKEGDNFQLLGVWGSRYEGNPPEWWDDVFDVLKAYFGIE